MTTRRKYLLLGIPVLLMPFVAFGGVIGSTELLIWFALVVAWIVLFITWGGKEPRSRSGEEVDVSAS